MNDLVTNMANTYRRIHNIGQVNKKKELIKDLVFHAVAITTGLILTFTVIVPLIW